MVNDHWLNRNVFITGCTGIVGSWLTKAMVDSGAVVTGLIRDFVPRSNLHLSGYDKKINVVHGALEDYEFVLRALNEYEIDTVFHIGAQAIVTTANRSALSTFDSNIRGTWNILEAARQTGLVERFIVASSDKSYGDHDKLPYEESFPLQGRHPYDVSKSCVDLISQTYYHTYGLAVAIARCGNIFGGGDLNFNRIVPGTIRSLYFDQRPIIRSDGSPVRDYFYVKDAVAAYIKLAEALDEPKFHGQAFNFSDERPLSARDIVDKIIELSGKTHLTPKILGKGKVRGEIDKQYLSARKARTQLRWKIHYRLEQALLETLTWYNDFFSQGPAT